MMLSREWLKNISVRSLQARHARRLRVLPRLFPKLGVGEWGFVYGVLPDTRIIHSTVDKAHMLSGAIRFTTSGEECNYNRQLGVVTFNKDRWGMAGSFTYVCPHDRANDVYAQKQNT